ncbi:antiviral RADAR system adenosine triphosphatase RdrA [Desulfovibrio gilichinskyi]|uniref:Uncharacterized protein YjbI, contains pentapeptide repeats n=1 Tax=Desulfovibrio gilichinskyi TaxID=1519643 RepID=A0A1X7CEI8_9BACT|nr:antiviral RADAR system adenosine triphosphatase RdrA [Desulfovibrio gilichinskyi]SME95115.1 Uncharacterized protein YjbI, contains pentapeptide repeats [Desulfovibrio gilichinskyi]
MSSNTESNKIVLNVNKSEYGYKLETEEVWQKDAASRLCKSLKRIGEQAKHYKRERKDKSSENLTYDAHDAIFVSAGRGCGKTVFLRNVKPIWEESDEFKNDIKLHFCPPIDPTLLAGNDNFVNVVIAHLYIQIDKEIKTGNHKDKNEFYKKLSRLADSVAQSENRDELPGIDRIISYKSGIQLEDAFHSFVEGCLDILNTDAIVLPIDDVDMALRKAFDVLDVVRRLLSCPYIIPIVSGDEDLYRPIIQDYFLHGENTGKEKLLAEDQADDLTDAYITKIFPNQHRVTLLSLDMLISNMIINDSNAKKNKRPSIRDYYAAVEAELCPLVNGQENSFDYPLPKTPRQLIQLTRSFPPSILEQYNDENQPDTTAVANYEKDYKSSFWYDFQNFAESRRHGTAYIVATSEQALIQMRIATDVQKNEHPQPRLPMRELLAFNISLQANHDTNWKEYSYYRKVLEGLLDPENDKTPSSIKKQAYLFKSIKDARIFRSMPITEFYIDPLYITQKNLPKKGETPLWLAIYLHKDFYGASQSQRVQLFFGRAFELVADSLLLASDGIKDARKKLWKKYLTELLALPPFHSSYSLNPTKVLEFEDENPDEDQGEDTPSEVSEDRSLMPTPDAIKEFAAQIADWELEHKDIIQPCQKKGLTHLLLFVMNKVFTQMHLLKIGETIKGNHATHSARRFEYVLINAFASFMKEKPVVLQNVLTETSSESLKDIDALFTRSSTLRTNIKEYIGVRKGDSFEEITTNKTSEDMIQDGVQVKKLDTDQKLLRAIWLHPLFRAIDGKGPEFKLGSKTYSNDSDQKDAEIAIFKGLSDKKIATLSTHKTLETLTKCKVEMKKRKLDSSSLTNEHQHLYEMLNAKYFDKLKSTNDKEQSLFQEAVASGNMTTLRFLLELAPVSKVNMGQWQGAALTAATMNRVKMLGILKDNKVDFTFESVVYSGQKLPKANFNNFSLKNAKFIETILTDAKFYNSNLSEADFTGADLRGAKFDDETIFTNTLISRTIFNEKDFNNLDLSKAKLESVVLIDENEDSQVISFK